MLKLMEAYIVGLADIPADQGGWSEAKRERALGVVRSLAGSLGQAERLASSMFATFLSMFNVAPLARRPFWKGVLGRDV
jgi:hypothetical protein